MPCTPPQNYDSATFQRVPLPTTVHLPKSKCTYTYNDQLRDHVRLSRFSYPVPSSCWAREASCWAREAAERFCPDVQKGHEQRLFFSCSISRSRNEILLSRNEILRSRSEISDFLDSMAACCCCCCCCCCSPLAGCLGASSSSSSRQIISLHLTSRKTTTTTNSACSCCLAAQ